MGRSPDRPTESTADLPTRTAGRPAVTGVNAKVLSRLRSELLALRRDFVEWDSAGLRLAFWISPKADDKKVSFVTIGTPINEASDDGAIVGGISDLPKCMAGNALTDRAGRLIHHAMDFISDASYQGWVIRHSLDQFSLVAYLATGVRSLRVQSGGSGRHWIDDPAPVCVEAIDWLLSRLPFAINENDEISDHSASGKAGPTDVRTHNEQDTRAMTTFDTFLSHNSQDKPVVRQLADALVARGLRPWLDERELVPGRPWQEALEEIIQTAKTAIVMFGPAGLGPWEEPEMRACLNEFVNRKLPVIPVLLPGAPQQPDLPLFLKAFTWVDLRGGLNDDGLDRLVWGITGRKPA